MKKTEYKFLLILIAIFSAFFINVSSAKADYNSDLLKYTCGNCDSFKNSDRYSECMSNFNTCKEEFDSLVTNNEYVNNQLDEKCDGKNGDDLIRCQSNVITNSMNAYSNNNETAKKIKEATNKINNDNGIYYEPAKIDIDCDDYSIFNKIWKFIIIVAPFLTIGLCALDGFRMVVAPTKEELKKHKKNLITRLIALILLIFTPVLVYIILTTLGVGNNKYLKTMRCIVAGK